MKRKGLCALALASLAVGGMLVGCGSSSSGSNGEVVVYNWGEYIDPDTITMFEEETGIKVIYDEFETNEIMYPKVESGASEYDVICPSDYMIMKMIWQAPSIPCGIAFRRPNTPTPSLSV